MVVSFIRDGMMMAMNLKIEGSLLLLSVLLFFATFPLFSCFLVFLPLVFSQSFKAVVDGENHEKEHGSEPSRAQRRRALTQ